MQANISKSLNNISVKNGGSFKCLPIDTQNMGTKMEILKPES